MVAEPVEVEVEVVGVADQVRVLERVLMVEELVVHLPERPLVGGRFCGLGCPLGAVVAGSSELMLRARRFKHMFGGAMRQAGIVAASGVYALEHNIDRLAEDHARARRLGEGLASSGLPVDPDEVETNFVQIDLEPLGLSQPEALERVHQAGVGISGTILPTRLRAVTHLDVTDEDIGQAIEIVPKALGVLVRA